VTETSLKLPVSVVIPTHNEQERLSKMLTGLLNQKTKPHEVIVVDNKSSDKTKQIALSCANKFKSKGITYKVVSEKKLGCAFARNKGFYLAKSPIIASTDADTIPHKDWIANIVRHFDKNDSVAVTGITVIKDSSLIVEYLSRVNWYKYLTLILRVIFGFQTITTANAAIRSNAFKKVSGFDTRCTSPDDLDDSEISSRLSKIGAIRVDTAIRVDGSFRRYQPLTRAVTSSFQRLKSWLRISKNYKTSL
jgi:cellulose synthase/poly-beta-1,6-N-acetylglucosamine synthase-like glycosyltransferase